MQEKLLTKQNTKHKKCFKKIQKEQRYTKNIKNENNNQKEENTVATELH